MWGKDAEPPGRPGRTLEVPVDGLASADLPGGAGTPRSFCLWTALLESGEEPVVRVTRAPGGTSALLGQRQGAGSPGGCLACAEAQQGEGKWLRSPAAWKPGSLPGRAGGGAQAPHALKFSSNYLFQDRLSLISICKCRPLLFQLAVK